MGVTAVVGGQFGSEGKGLIVAHIAKDYDTHVRVGAANAGHTFYTGKPGIDEEPGSWGWEKHVMQQLPCAAYANTDAELYIGPGALISLDIFLSELNLLQKYRAELGYPPIVVNVDARAHVITQDQIQDEAESGLAQRIGSTSATAREGIGQAQADRVMRAERCLVAFKCDHLLTRQDVRFVDTPARIRSFDDGDTLLEGTQGASLSLTTGVHPFITSRNTTSAGLLADCGIAPNQLTRCIMVCRSFPIRVAGNSGSFWFDSLERKWEDIGVDPNSERTTVTKKIRRVATISYFQLAESASLNGATDIALTFADYVDRECAGIGGGMSYDELAGRYPRVWSMMERIHAETDVQVTMVGTGPHSVIDLY